MRGAINTVAYLVSVSWRDRAVNPVLSKSIKLAFKIKKKRIIPFEFQDFSRKSVMGLTGGSLQMQEMALKTFSDNDCSYCYKWQCDNCIWCIVVQLKAVTEGAEFTSMQKGLRGWESMVPLPIHWQLKPPIGSRSASLKCFFPSVQEQI